MTLEEAKDRRSENALQNGILTPTEEQPEVPPVQKDYPNVKQNLSVRFATCIMGNGGQEPERQDQTSPETGISDNSNAMDTEMEAEGTAPATFGGTGNVSDNSNSNEESAAEFGANPNLSTDSNPTDGEWKTVGSNDKPSDVAAKKAKMIGIKLVRMGTRGATGYHPKDLAVFFEELSQIDPGAIILNHACDPISATPVAQLAKFTSMDYKGFLDMKSDPWGGPTENKERTVWMCYAASDTLAPSLQALRKEPRMRKYLNNGNISLQFTKLKESNSRVAFHVAHKDPKHTNRNELEARLAKHINAHADHPIPIHLLDMAVRGKSYNTRMCTAVVGGKDRAVVERVMTQHLFPDLEIIPFSWKHKHPAAYEQKLKEHDMITNMSRAFRLEQVDQTSVLPHMREMLMKSDAKPSIVDISPASHAATSGVVYVQYLQPHKDLVLSALEGYLAKLQEQAHLFRDNSAFPDGPVFENYGGSVAPTINSHSQASAETGFTIPESRFQEILSGAPASAPSPWPQQAPVPKSIDLNARSFSDVLRGASTTDQTDISDDDTVSADNTSGKRSARELALEAENDQLRKQLETMEAHYQEEMERGAELARKMAALEVSMTAQQTALAAQQEALAAKQEAFEIQLMKKIGVTNLGQGMPPRPAPHCMERQASVDTQNTKEPRSPNTDITPQKAKQARLDTTTAAVTTLVQDPKPSTHTPPEGPLE